MEVNLKAKDNIFNTVSFDDGKNPDAKSQTKKSGGTFQSMGFNRAVVKAVIRKGYKIATPIQRKCIPHVLAGRDVVAMARTGSGKTAAFILPMVEKLKGRQAKQGIRALIISPVRELARQTYKFVQDFTKYTDLRTALITGGESMDKDFEAITSCPDILIATPGRLAHVLVDMKSKLPTVEYVVFDEADRLFEPGYKELEQVLEISSRLGDNRQTLLFSATMPQKLADFAKVGLKNPVFIRLDVDANLSENLKTIHLLCNNQDKTGVLLYLLKNFVQNDQATVVFLATKHHVEYLKMLLTNASIECSYVYSSLDPEARKLNVDKFVRKKCNVLLVTDVAARGIDIPILDNVINYNFPSKPKLFIHRVGRVARAGRSGCAISLVAYDEAPYLHALHLFLGMPVITAASLKSKISPVTQIDSLPNAVYGCAPQDIVDDENDVLRRWHKHDVELEGMVKVCENAMKPYMKTRQPPGAESVRIMKDLHKKPIGIHPLFKLMNPTVLESDLGPSVCSEESVTNLMDRLKSFKPLATIFEVGHIKGNRSTEAFGVMQKKRNVHDKIVVQTKKRENEDDCDPDESNDEQPPEITNSATNGKKRKFKDDEFYLDYQPADQHKEKGLEIDKSSFSHDLNRATFDIIADDENVMKKQKHQMIWDRKKKKYVTQDQLTGNEKKVKKIRTESGAYIAASYQSGLFEKWKSKSKFDQQDDEDEMEEMTVNSGKGQKSNSKDISKLKARTIKNNPRRSELRKPEVILKDRLIKDKREAILRMKTKLKAKRNAPKEPSGVQRGGRKGSRGKGAKGRKSTGGQDSSHSPFKGGQKGRGRPQGQGGRGSQNGRRSSSVGGRGGGHGGGHGSGGGRRSSGGGGHGSGHGSGGGRRSSGGGGRGRGGNMAGKRGGRGGGKRR